MGAIAMRTDPYIIDTLMRDLVTHSHSSAAFLVYLQLYRQTHGAGRESMAMSHAVLSESTGLSRRSVQTAVAHLADRRLIRRRKARPTSVPVYTVLTPWIRKKPEIQPESELKIHKRDGLLSGAE
jgi:hypothetical protein